MHETQPTLEPAPAPAAPPLLPPITSLKGYWIIVLPLLALLGQMAVGFIVGIFIGAAGLARGGSPLLFIVAIAGFAALSYLLIVQILLANRGWRWRDLGLRKSANAPVVAAILIGVGTCLLATLFERAANPGASLFRRMSGAELVLAGLVIGVLVPFAEEVVFRGVVYPVLRARIGDTTAAVLISALIFGSFHLYPLQIVVGFVLGMPLAWLRQWSGSLLAPIALHMTHNLGVIIVAAWRIV
jgi:membrane protease YdiL (CAAX protease family)